MERSGKGLLSSLVSRTGEELATACFLQPQCKEGELAFRFLKRLSYVILSKTGHVCFHNAGMSTVIFPNFRVGDTLMYRCALRLAVAFIDLSVMRTNCDLAQFQLILATSIIKFMYTLDDNFLSTSSWTLWISNNFHCLYEAPWPR